MSQHDGTITNDTGAAVRTDVQAGLQASLSTSKGNSAPATKYAGQHYIRDTTPSSNIWTEFVWDGADGIALWYIDTASNVAYPVSAMPLLGFSAQGSPVMAGDIRTSASVAQPGNGNTTPGYNLSSNGSLHLNNSGSYTLMVGKTGAGTAVIFTSGGTSVGNISVTGSATAYNTSSDERLKTDIEAIDWREAVAELAKLRPVWFHWISQPLGEWVDGFIAHEVQEHMPHVVTGARGATEWVTHEIALDDDGNVVMEKGKPKRVPLDRPFERIVPQGIDQSKFTPLLVAAFNGLVAAFIAEVSAKDAVIADLSARMEALEARSAPDGR